VIRYALRDSVTNEAGQMIKATSVIYNLPGGAQKTVKASFYGADLFRATIPAQVAGAIVTVKLSATDRFGNTGTSAPFTYTVPIPAPPPVVVGAGGGGGTSGTAGGSAGATAGLAGSGGASAGTGGGAEAGAAETAEGGEGGEGGESSVGGQTSVAGASPGAGGKPSGKAGSSSSVGGNGEAGEPMGTAGKGHYETVDDGGCSVAINHPASRGRGAALLGIGLAMLGLVRRRRNHKH